MPKFPRAAPTRTGTPSGRVAVLVRGRGSKLRQLMETMETMDRCTGLAPSRRLVAFIRCRHTTSIDYKLITHK